jgi:hypothetical protein
MTSPPRRRCWASWLPFVLGAMLGGLIASGAPLAAAGGGIAGALVGGLGAWLLRRPWPAVARWAAALTVWGLGFMALLMAAGFMRAVRGLAGGAP